ncbi:MAG: DUF2723 domain-containing protein [Myxococcales bacterium FL481]|nr:MAG: DUF2723 domain-containing protein [Myxococcales bacterium FL481]
MMLSRKFSEPRRVTARGFSTISHVIAFGFDRVRNRDAATTRHWSFSLRLSPRVGWTVGCGTVLTLLMLWALPRHVQGGDAGEFSTVLLRGGVPHPSGYPLMRMLGPFARLLEWLGLNSATAAAFPPAAAGVAGWTGLATLLSRWFSGPAGAIAVLLAASSSLAVVHTFDCEVWGPQLLFAAIVLSEATRAPPQALRLGLVFGLATAHHLTAVFFAPLVMAAIWPPRAPRRADGMRLLGVGAGWVVGLMAFVTLAWGSEGAWRWGDLSTARGLLAHVLREDYGVFSLGLHHAQPSPWSLWARVVTSLSGSISAGRITSVVPGLLLIGVCCGLAPRARGVPPRVWWAVMVTFVALTFGFPAMHNVDPRTPFAAWILERFDLLPLFVLTIFTAGTIERLRRSRIHWQAPILGVGSALLLSVQLLRTHGRGAPRHEPGVEAYARDLLRTPDEPFAIVFGTDDHRTFPVLFAQEVLGLGRHVLYVDAQLLAHSWYRARLRRRFPAFPDVPKPLAAIGHLWSGASTRDTPIYLANVFSRPAESQLNRVPEGILWRVVPPHATAAAFGVDAVTRRHVAACARYRTNPAEFAGMRHPQTHPWSGDLWHAYRDGTKVLSDWYQRRGQGDAAKQLSEGDSACVAPPAARPRGTAP